MELLHAFCALWKPKLATLVFINVVVHLWWKLNDIVQYIIELKDNWNKIKKKVLVCSSSKVRFDHAFQLL
jgi:hypothetical protein